MVPTCPLNCFALLCMCYGMRAKGALVWVLSLALDHKRSANLNKDIVQPTVRVCQANTAIAITPCILPTGQLVATVGCSAHYPPQSVVWHVRFKTGCFCTRRTIYAQAIWRSTLLGDPVVTHSTGSPANSNHSFLLKGLW